MPKPFTTSSASAGNGPLTSNHSSGENKRLVFQPETISVHQTWGIFITAFVIAAFFSIILFIGFEAERKIIWPLVIVGSLLELIPIATIVNCLLKRRSLPVFDSINKLFYPQGTRHPEAAVSTKDIDHLQIIRIDLMRGCCYELNAVMMDGNRLHIMEDGIQNKFMREARQLADRLSLSLKDGYGNDFVYDPKQDTGPLVPNGSNFQNTELVFRQDSITVRATWKFYLIISVFAAVFGLPLIIFLSGANKDIPRVFLGIFTTFEAFFFGLIIYSFFKRSYPLFDMVDGMFYPKGFTRDGSGIPLKQLDHLEIVKERVYNKNSSYDSYELNVALKDGSRYNIMDHGADKLLLADAKQLAEKLSLPLINADTAQPITHEEIKLHKEFSAPMTAGGAVFLIIFGLMFFGAGSLAAWMVCLKPMSGVIASGNWTPTPARIISSHLDRSSGSKGGSTYRINIQYQYDVNGSHFTSNRYDFFRSGMSSNVGVGTMRKIVSDHSEGKEITCLVNPANPTEAVISRSIPWFFALFMLFPLPFLFIGGMTIFTAIKSLVKPPTQKNH